MPARLLDSIIQYCRDAPLKNPCLGHAGVWEVLENLCRFRDLLKECDQTADTENAWPDLFPQRADSLFNLHSWLRLKSQDDTLIPEADATALDCIEFSTGFPEGNGVAARRDLELGETVLVVPRGAFLTSTQAMRSDFLSALFQDTPGLRNLPVAAALVIQILAERGTPSSAFAPYLRVLPRDISMPHHGTPSDDILGQLRYSPILPLLTRLIFDIIYYYALVAGPWQRCTGRRLRFGDWQWGYDILATRQNMVTSMADQEPKTVNQTSAAFAKAQQQPSPNLDPARTDEIGACATHSKKTKTRIKKNATSGREPHTPLAAPASGFAAGSTGVVEKKQLLQMLVLLPGFDMFNHSCGLPMSTEYDESIHAVRCMAPEFVKSGHQVRIAYAQSRTVSALFLHSGFVPPDANLSPPVYQMHLVFLGDPEDPGIREIESSSSYLRAVVPGSKPRCWRLTLAAWYGVPSTAPVVLEIPVQQATSMLMSFEEPPNQGHPELNLEKRAFLLSMILCAQGDFETLEALQNHASLARGNRDLDEQGATHSTGRQARLAVKDVAKVCTAKMRKRATMYLKLYASVHQKRLEEKLCQPRSDSTQRGSANSDQPQKHGRDAETGNISNREILLQATIRKYLEYELEMARLMCESADTYFDGLFAES